jgi:hypothetical protein
MDFNTIPNQEVLTKVSESLKANGIETIIAENSTDAKAKALAFIPEGSEVFTMTSKTLEAIDILSELNESGKYNSVRTMLNGMDGKTQGREMRKLGAAPDFAIGSVHAVTENGEIFIASNTGSQLPAYAYGAGTVVWVIGAQKIVKDKEEAMKRVYEYVLPLESERAHQAYGIPGSAVNKMLVINKEGNPERLKVVLVKESLGF